MIKKSTRIGPKKQKRVLGFIYQKVKMKKKKVRNHVTSAALHSINKKIIEFSKLEPTRWDWSISQYSLPL